MIHVKCPMCRKSNTPDGRRSCIDCGYIALAMADVSPNRKPRSDKLRRCLDHMRAGDSRCEAAKKVGITAQSAWMAFLTYIVLPEWAEFKQDHEEYAEGGAVGAEERQEFNAA